jgi:L-ascorbate metabolism protein UlaG (beta-lactamase superfamily)
MPKVTFLGHSCFLIEGGGSSILIDPFLTGNPQASTTADAVSCDHIIVTHAHGDHLGDTIDIARRTGAQVISNFEIAGYCQGKEVAAHALHIGGGYQFPFGRAKLTIAHHGSSFPDGTYGGNPAGVTLTIDGKKIHHAGDTALTLDMQLVGNEGVDLAMLPIGDNFTMGIDDAVKALEFIRPSQVVPMHYNTFEVIEVDPERFRKESGEKGVACTVLNPGDSLTL